MAFVRTVFIFLKHLDSSAKDEYSRVWQNGPEVSGVEFEYLG